MVLFSDLLRSEEKKVENRKNVFFENQQLDDMAQHFVNLHRYFGISDTDPIITTKLMFVLYAMWYACSLLSLFLLTE